MIERREVGKPAQITFTCDFHELVTGDLCAGQPVRLSYDPRRIAPAEDIPIIFGGPQRPVTVFIRFRDDAPALSIEVASAGKAAVPDEDPTGQGSMLKTRVQIPDDAQRVSIWFLYVSANGKSCQDNDYGRNFNFRFPRQDITVLDADVSDDPQKRLGRFSVSVEAASCIDDISVRFYSLGSTSSIHHEAKLLRSDVGTAPNRSIWSVAGLVVPYEAVIRFKIFYWVSGIRYKDDNSGHYYLAPQPLKPQIPPPPASLATAAQAWK